MFFTLSAITFLPLIIKTLHKIFNKESLDQNYYAQLWLTAATIAIVFFFVNTQMHERYSFPAIPMYFAYALLSNRYSIFALTSIAHLMNVDGTNKYLGLNPFRPEYTAILFGIILCISLIRIYHNFKLKLIN